MKKRWTRPFGIGLLVLSIAEVAPIPAVASAEEQATSAIMRPTPPASRTSCASASGHRPVPPGGGGDRGWYELGWGERLRGEDHHRLRLPDGWGDGLPILQPRASG